MVNYCKHKQNITQINRTEKKTTKNREKSEYMRD
jgi:hypothetical protein